jgi:hypothetical protein
MMRSGEEERKLWTVMDVSLATCTTNQVKLARRRSEERGAVMDNSRTRAGARMK